MSDLFTAAENIRRFAQQFSGIIAVAETLEKLGQLDQIVKEQQVQADAAVKEADAAKAEVKKAKDQVKAEKDKATGIVAEAQETAAKTLADAVAAAQIEAAHIVKKAQDEGAAMIQQAATEKARLSSEIGGLQRAIEAAKSELALLAQDKDAAEAATADAVKKLEAAKAKVKALFE